jgi:O-antigen/teichoic acid export membrane protein
MSHLQNGRLALSQASSEWLILRHWLKGSLNLPNRETTGIVRRIYSNLGLLLGGKAAAGLLSLAYMIIAARALGPSDYGVLVLVHGYVMTVGGIIEFPGWHAVVRYGAQAIAGGDSARMVRLLRFTGLVELGGGAVAVLIAALLAPLIGPHLGWSPTAQAFAVPYSLAVLASIRSTPAGFLQLMRRFDLLGAHNAVAPMVRLIGAALVGWFGWGLKGFLIAWLVAALAEWLTLWLMGLLVARRELGEHPLVAGISGVRSENPGIWRFMISANADITFGELAGRIAPLVVGWMAGPAAAGLYAVAQRATVIIAQPAQMLGQAAYAELAKLVADGGHGVPVRRALRRCMTIALTTALPVLLLLAFFSQQFAILLGGPAFVGAAGLMIWLALARVLLVIAPSASAALVAMGRPGLSVTANLVSSIGLLPLLPLLIQQAGLGGAGFHAVLQSLVACALLIWFVWRTSDPGNRPRGASAVA